MTAESEVGQTRRAYRAKRAFLEPRLCLLCTWSRELRWYLDFEKGNCLALCGGSRTTPALSSSWCTGEALLLAPILYACAHNYGILAHLLSIL